MSPGFPAKRLYVRAYFLSDRRRARSNTKKTYVLYFSEGATKKEIVETIRAVGPQRNIEVFISKKLENGDLSRVL